MTQTPGSVNPTGIYHKDRVQRQQEFRSLEATLKELGFIEFANGMIATDGDNCLLAWSAWRHRNLGQFMLHELKSGNVVIYKIINKENFLEEAAANVKNYRG